MPKCGKTFNFMETFHMGMESYVKKRTMIPECVGNYFLFKIFLHLKCSFSCSVGSVIKLRKLEGIRVLARFQHTMSCDSATKNPELVLRSLWTKPFPILVISRKLC